MTSTTHGTTAEQLFHMQNDGYRYELVKGVLKKMTPAGFKHGAIIANLTALLAQHVRDNGLGIITGSETGYKIGSNPDTVRAPDIAFVRRDRIPESGLPDAFWVGPPDLAVEVLSPHDTVYETDEKIEAWLEAGAAAVWVIHPKRRTVEIHQTGSNIRILTDKDSLEGNEIVPGFRCGVTEILP